MHCSNLGFLYTSSTSSIINQCNYLGGHDEEVLDLAWSSTLACMVKVGGS